MTSEPIVYLNRAFILSDAARISAEDRGFLLGDAVFDTIRSYRGRLFRFEDHADRLFEGLEEMRIPAPFSRDELAGIFTELIRRNGGSDRVVRITVSRGLGAGGYRLSEGARPTVYANSRPVPDVAALRAVGVRLEVSPVPRPLPFLNVVKTTSLGAMALARTLSEAFEVIMRDAEGFVAEGAASTLFAIRGDSIVTPASARRLLPSVTRHVIEKLAVVKEARMTLEEFLSSDAIFLAATSAGPVPVRAVDDRVYAITHPVLLRLLDAFDAEVARECGSDA
jgi:branched-subunit amino acid aminotransferase/4-amino-4-deoxychorismate lyase